MTSDERRANRFLSLSLLRARLHCLGLNRRTISRFRFCFKLGSPPCVFVRSSHALEICRNRPKGLGPGRFLAPGVRTATAAGPSRARAFGSAASCTRPETPIEPRSEAFQRPALRIQSPVRCVSIGGSLCPLSVSRRMIGVLGLPGGIAAARVLDHHLNAVTRVRGCGRAGRL